MTLALLAQLFTGYSLGTLLVLALTQFNARQYSQQPVARWAGRGLLAALGVLQLVHGAWLWGLGVGMQSPAYGAALLLVAPCFYLVAVQVLMPLRQAPHLAEVLTHLAPMAAVVVVPVGWTLPLAFGVGSLYLAWLLRALWTLRSARAQWAHEVALLGLAAFIGVGVCMMGLLQGGTPTESFYALYAMAIGLALLLVQVLLGLRPHLAQEVAETARAAPYATTTLASVDVPAVLARLDGLMEERHRYRNAELSLPTLAQELGLSAHQLSELLNTRMGKGFGRYLRELRVAGAKRMLVQEPTASVLSVGLNMGFCSQSNFYEAFREIEGCTPGQYRKLQLAQVAEKSTIEAPV